MATIQNTTHGQKWTPTYTCWQNMLNRCRNPHVDSYPRYGGRGIRVAPEFETFEGFHAALGDKPPGMSLDRIDVNGHYEPGNVRWAAPKTQARNTRTNRQLTHDGRTQPLVAWAEETGVSEGAIYMRLRRGWPVEKALTTPPLA